MDAPWLAHGGSLFRAHPRRCCHVRQGLNVCLGVCSRPALTWPPPCPVSPRRYLQQPEAVFGEIARVLRPGGVCVFSFSNRLFYNKVRVFCELPTFPAGCATADG